MSYNTASFKCKLETYYLIRMHSISALQNVHLGVWLLYDFFLAPKICIPALKFIQYSKWLSSQEEMSLTCTCFHQSFLTNCHEDRQDARRGEEEELNISYLGVGVYVGSCWTWFTVTRGTVIWLNHFSGHFVRRISCIIPLIAMSNAIAWRVLSQAKVSDAGQKVTFCLQDYFLKHLSRLPCEKLTFLFVREPKELREWEKLATLGWRWMELSGRSEKGLLWRSAGHLISHVIAVHSGKQ